MQLTKNHKQNAWPQHSPPTTEPRFFLYIYVTECICTLCLYSCMYLGYVALSVFFRVCTSVNLLRMRYVLRFRRHYETSLELRAREGEREEQRPLACTIQKKRRNKIRNLWLWFVCCSLLPTCNFHHRPFTSIFIYKNIYFKKKGGGWGGTNKHVSVLTLYPLYCVDPTETRKIIKSQTAYKYS